MPEPLIEPTWYPPAGSALLAPIDNTVLTDASPARTLIVSTRNIDSLVVDVVCDKGCSLVIRPLPDIDDPMVKGESSDALTVADGGGAVRGRYTDIGAPAAEIVVTKTESGDMTAMLLAVRGL